MLFGVSDISFGNDAQNRCRSQSIRFAKRFGRVFEISLFSIEANYRFILRCTRIGVGAAQ